MSFAQVCGVVTCAVAAFVGCGTDRAIEGNPDDDSSSENAGAVAQEVGAAPITATCTVALMGPATALIGTPVHVSATAACTTGAAEVQFYHRAGTTSYQVFRPYGAVMTADWPSTGAPGGAHQFLAKVRMVGTTRTTTSNTLTVTLDQAPVAVADAAMVTEDYPATIDVVANDSDADGDALTVTAVGAASHGTVAIASAHQVRYTPALDYNGADTFSYTISDGRLGTATASVAITVTSVDDPPVAVGDSASVAEDGSVTIDVAANDSDVDGDALALASVTAPAHGTATIADDHHVTYAPAANFHGSDAFSYTIVDASGAPATATVTVTVTSVNDAPLASDDAASLDEDGAVTVDVVGNDFDVDGDALAITAITQPAHGLAVIVDDHHVSYTPAPNYHGGDALSYTISDGSATASATLTLTIASVNDAPVAVADAGSLDEDTSLTLDVVGNDHDLDGDALAVIAVTAPAHGTATIGDAHHVTYVPAADYHGGDSFSYTISDGAGGTASATVALTVAPVNDAPVAAADAASLDEDTSASVDVVANDRDVDGDDLRVTSVTAPAHGTATIADAHHVTYAPAADYHGDDRFDYTISDGAGGTASATVSVTVASVNDAPVASAAAASTFDDTPVVVTFAASDVDGDALSFAIAAAPAHGTLGAVAGNHVTYTPAPGFAGSDSFTFAASDGALTATAVAAITVVQSVCGNGVREGVHEECDDGNATPGDGCEATCRLTCGSGTGADRATVDAASGHCFAAYDGVVGSYQQAAALCTGFGGHLATITSASEDAAAFAAVHAGDHPWLGGDDLAAEATFRWTTGEPLGYRHFATGKPDNAGNADCLHYLADGTWSDTACAGGAVTGTLCESELVAGTTVLATGGAGTHGAAVADFNGDGFADLAATHPASNTVGVLLGNGAGGFAPAVTYATGTAPIAVAAGDFDSDGHVDLATANAGTVSVLLGSAGGGFTAGATVAIGNGATAIAAADTDGDGALDLVVGVAGGLQILHGDGAGGFTAGGSIALTLLGAPAAIAAGDFDHDGHVDLAVATSLAVLILHGGTSGFGLPVTLAVSLGNRALVATDLDGDGNLDLAVASGATGVTVFLGSALGALTSSQTLTVGGPAQLVVTGDFDGDGGTDLIAVTDDAATLFHGASGAFTQVGGPVATGGEGASFAVAASLNGDAAQDLVIAHAASSTAGVVFGGPGGLAGARALVVGEGSTSTVVGDFNEDGRSDLAVIDPAASKVFVFTQTATGELTLSATVTMQTDAGSSYGLAADIDGDGHLDLAIANVGFSSISVLLGAGNGTFGSPLNTGTGRAPRRFAVGDFNGDGKPDLAVATTLGNVVSILINADGGHFGRVDDVAAGITPAAVAVGDFDGDGKLDLAVATLGEASVKLTLGHGDGTFGSAAAFATAAPGEAIAAADLDGDGKLDLAAVCAATGNVSVLLGTGTGSFATATSVATGAGPASLIATDLDGDGHLDLVVGNADSGDATVLHGDPAGGFVASRVAIGAAPSGISAADLDHDGHLDLAVSTTSAIVTLVRSPR